MKKLKYIFILLITVTITSCDFVDVVPDNLPTIDHAFSNEFTGLNYLRTCYSSLPNPSSSNPGFVADDEIWHGSFYKNFDPIKLAKGQQSINSVIYDKWESSYKAIRKCNIFLDNIHKILGLSNSKKKRWIAEAKFLKAYYHFYLIRMYGPIIISDKQLDVMIPSDDVANVSREPVEKCFAYVVNLLDEAIKDLDLFLPNPVTDLGRIDKTIAASFKAEVLMLAASPLFNGNTAYTVFKTKEGKALFPMKYSNDKWIKAAEACKVAIDLAHAAELHLVTTDDIVFDYKLSEILKNKIKLRSRVTKKWNKEIIWGSTHGTLWIQLNSVCRLMDGIEGNPVISAYAPSIRIAEMYYSKNGVPIDEDVSYPFDSRYQLRVSKEENKALIKKGETTASLNFDRELRFYSDLAFDRSVWHMNGKLKDNDFWVIKNRNTGKDYSRNGEKSQENITGYFVKKLVHMKGVFKNSRAFDIQSAAYSFPYMRLAGLYLLYSEALNESMETPNAEVYKWIDIVRKRAGLDGVVEAWTKFSSNPAKPSSKQGMRKIIHRERNIELAFEGKRFWDLRRWKEALITLNTSVEGWNIEGSTAANYYTVKQLGLMKFEVKDYLWPIRESNIINNPSLLQNPGW